MPAVNFLKRYAPKVASGEKRQTVRMRQFSIGAQLHLFTGMRTKSCQRLGKGVVTSSRPIVIDYVDYVPSIQVNGIDYSVKEMEAFARADGFSDLDAFMAYFSEQYDLPMAAWVTEWDRVPQTEEVAA